MNLTINITEACCELDLIAALGDITDRLRNGIDGGFIHQDNPYALPYLIGTWKVNR